MSRFAAFCLVLLVLTLLWVPVPRPVSAQEVTPAPAPGDLAAGGISSPGNDESLSGIVIISGTAPSAWDLSFSFAENPVDAWFPIAQSTEPVFAGALASWDTTTITDGFYVLRLRLSGTEAAQDFKINLRVRNYSPAETATPGPTLTVLPTSTSLPNPEIVVAATATFTPAPSPTMPGPLSPNPAVLKPEAIALNFGKGAFGVAVVFVFFGLLFSLSRKLRL